MELISGVKQWCESVVSIRSVNHTCQTVVSISGVNQWCQSVMPISSYLIFIRRLSYISWKCLCAYNW